MRRAAERLHMAQPPLSRKIAKLEESLGVELFTRHSRGLELTEAGERALAIASPFLRQYSEMMESLQGLGGSARKIMVIGLTTAFEQGVFSSIQSRLSRWHGGKTLFVRKTSPLLAREILKGKMDLAFVALPLEAPGLSSANLDYEEKLLAVLPEIWPEAAMESISMAMLSGKRLFWFRREQNPAWFDGMAAIFRHIGFSPIFVEEPPEHDVLLARIAAGDGMGLLPESFAAIARRGVGFRETREQALLRINLGLLYRDATPLVREILAAKFGQAEKKS